jgi:hypothetical protein
MASEESLHLADLLADYFSNPFNGWFTPFMDALRGIDAAQAAVVPAPRFNSIWAVVKHVRHCEEMVLAQLCNRPEVVEQLNLEGDWPPIGQPGDEAAWQADCQKALEVNQQLAERIKSEENILQISATNGETYWKLVQGVANHNSYHTCEIISIRHLQQNWIKEV